MSGDARTAAPDEAAAPPLLGGLSNLAGRGFADAAEATDEILRLVTTHFGMRTGFIADIDPAANRFTVVAARDEPGGCGVAPGFETNLLDTY